MKSIVSRRFSTFAVATMAVIILACIFSILGMTFSSAEALTQEELSRKYDFSIDTGDYISGIATDLYNLPVFDIQFTQIYNGAFVGDNRDIRFYYAFADTLVNPLTSIPVESWEKLRSASDVVEEGGVVQYQDIEGIATIDFSLEQVTDGYIDNYVFHKFVYFKVENTALEENPYPKIF